MTVPPYQFGISEFTTMPWSFEEDIAHYSALGVNTIEVCEVKLDQSKIDAQMRLVSEHGLGISSVQPVTRTLYPSQSQPEPKPLDDRLARFRQTVETLSPWAKDAPFVTNLGIAPNGNMQEALDTAASAYRALAQFAADHGVRVAIEPLSASIVNIETAIWTVEQGLELIRAVDHPAFGLCLDFWNVWQNADLAAAIHACGDRIFLVQLSDWRTPRSFLDRLVPGQGKIPLPALLRAAHDSGYRGPYVVEIFSDNVPNALWQSDLTRLIQDCRAGMETAWQRAFEKDSPMNTTDTPTIDSAPQPGTQAASSQADAAPAETSAPSPRTDQAEIEAEEAAIGEGPEATPSPS